MQTVLATGGTGFIGSHTCVELLKKGYRVILLDSLINSSENVFKKIQLIVKAEKPEYSDNCSFILGDLRNKELLEEIFKKASFENRPISAVIHFAGLKSVSESISNPLKYWDANVLSSINLFKLMDKYDCRKIVFSSSATVYSINDGSLLKENSPIGPCNPYGRTKFVIECLLNDIYANSNNDWRIVNLRYFNPIGAHISGMIGENSKDIPNNIFPILNNVAIGNIPKIQIFGNDWPTPDGTGVRDYIHVMDLAVGHVKALEYLENKESQLLNLNLGTGKGTSVLDLIKTFEKVNKVKINYEFTQRRLGDYGVVVADNSLAKKLLNWIPMKDIIDMCRDGWYWQSKNRMGHKK